MSALKLAIATLEQHNADLLLIGTNSDRKGIFSIRETNTLNTTTATPEMYDALVQPLLANPMFIEVHTNPNVVWTMLDVKNKTLRYKMGDSECEVALLQEAEPADMTKSPVRLNTADLYFLLFKKYVKLGDQFLSPEKKMVALLDVHSGHLVVFSRTDFMMLYHNTLRQFSTSDLPKNGDVVVDAGGGPLFKRIGPRLTLHRMQAIWTYDTTVITVSRGNLGFLHVDRATAPTKDAFALLNELSAPDTDFLIKAIYDRPFTAGVVNQSVPRPDSGVTKTHPLFEKGERCVLMKGGRPPIIASIDRTYM